MDLQYHQQALRLAGHSAAVSAAAVAALDELETRHDITLPASVREWYSLASAVEILRRHSNDDRPYRIEELGRPADEESDCPDPVASQGLLPFMVENQGVCYWAVRLDGSADPEVLVSFEDLAPDSWLPHARSFSEFVLTQIWDRPTGDANRHVHSKGEQPTPADLTALGELFERLPSTANSTTHRFVGAAGDQRITLIEEMWGGWACYLWAATDQLLRELITTLRTRTSLAQALRSYDDQSAGARLIAALPPAASEVPSRAK
ncbi:SMI1/KNR4 family protein [Streptomyces sp. NPDC000987]|uniref:SMI1/KNR4 family protein n=1 Tax=Streptomyces sp. NPDC000987 TaxID=3154374 RepID=UPI0033256476